MDQEGVLTVLAPSLIEVLLLWAVLAIRIGIGVFLYRNLRAWLRGC